jgi:peptidoglycan/LPS O-acetylase OafA/YrhL
MRDKKPLGASRDRHLDGLRGVAALVVVIEHVAALLPIGRWQIGTGVAGEFLSNLVHSPLEAGNFAVYIFFAISGVVVANAAGGKPWPLSLAGRYARLTTPMLFAGLVAWLLLTIFPGELPAISAFHPNHWTTSIYQNGAPTLWAALKEPLYAAYANGNPTTNPVLWSMQIELWGSFGIFTVYAAVPERHRLRVNIAIAALLILLGYWQYLAFPLGAALYELKLRARFGWRRRLGVLVALAGVGLGVVATLSAWRYYSRVMSGHLWFDADLKVLISGIGGILIVTGVLASETSRTILTSRVPLFLGRTSYCLYLIHMPLLYTAFAALYLRLGEPPRGVALALWSVAFFATALIAGWLMTIWIDEPATKLFRVRRHRPRA